MIFLVMTVVPVVFTFEAIVIKMAVTEIGSVFSFEPCVIVVVVNLVAKVSMPCGIFIICIPGVRRFEINADVDL